MDLQQAGFEEIWKRLTPQERERFKHEVDSGVLQEAIAEWKPWWMLVRKGPVIDVEEEKALFELLPVVEPGIKPLSQLSKVSPPKELVFNLVEILYTFCYTARLLNGEVQEEFEEAQRILLLVSHVLSTQEKFAYSTVAQAATGPMQRVRQQPSLSGDPELVSVVLDDICVLLSDKHLVLVALSETQRILTHVRSGAKANRGAFLGAKKASFYLSWVTEQPGADLEGLVMFLQDIKREEKEMHKKHKMQKLAVEQAMQLQKGKPAANLVEEIK